VAEFKWRLFQARRAGIFVDYGYKTNQAPFRSDIIGICRPDGAEILFGLWFYIDTAPMALGTYSVGAVRRCFRATGSTLQPQSEFRIGNELFF
jgi:hypothetical protein